jgi:hypothetical protein
MVAAMNSITARRRPIRAIGRRKGYEREISTFVYAELGIRGFMLLDLRNEQLINLSRDQLCDLESRLYVAGEFPGIFNTANNTAAKICGLARFGVVMPTIYIIAAIIFLCLSAHAGGMWLGKFSTPTPPQRAAASTMTQ